MRYLTIREAGELAGISRQAIQAAIANHRLPAKKTTYRYFILFDDLDRYIKSKWDRLETTMVNGIKVFDQDEGGISVRKAAELLGVKRQHLYNLIRSGHIKRMVVGCVFLIKKADVLAYKNSHQFSAWKKAQEAILAV